MFVLLARFAPFLAIVEKKRPRHSRRPRHDCTQAGAICGRKFSRTTGGGSLSWETGRNRRCRIASLHNRCSRGPFFNPNAEYLADYTADPLILRRRLSVRCTRESGWWALCGGKVTAGNVRWFALCAPPNGASAGLSAREAAKNTYKSSPSTAQKK